MGNDPIKKPEIIVFAGPNGSGKSTITDLLRPPMVPYINADEIQRVLGCDNMELALRFFGTISQKYLGRLPELQKSGERII